jgi:hypothetical protein
MVPSDRLTPNQVFNAMLRALKDEAASTSGRRSALQFRVGATTAPLNLIVRRHNNRRSAPMNHEQPKPSLQGSCHCGAVRLTLPTAPDKATSCNCSLCRRTGGIWAYYQFGTVSVQGHPENTESYIWGDRTLRNVRCKICGIVTHWEPLKPEPGARHGVNLRNFEPALLESVVVRRFDGADTWKFLD